MADRSLVVRLRAEVDQFRQDMAQAAQATGLVGQAAAQAGQQRTAMQRLGAAGREVGRTLAAAAGVAGAGLAALGATALTTGLQYNVLEQTSRAALSTLIGSTEAAEAQMDDLREFVETRLFPREVFIQAQQQMLAFGFAAEDVIPTLRVLEDAVAATGGTAQVFSEVVQILSRVQSTGQVTAETMNELGRRGINAAQLIGDQMGQTEAQIRESITRGALDGREAIELLVVAMEDRFGGGAEALTEQWVGASGLVAAGLRNIGSAATEAFVDPSGGGAAVQWANDVAEVLGALHGQIEDLVDVLSQQAEPTFEAISQRLQSVAAGIEDLDLTDVVDQVRDGAPAFAALGAGIAAAGSAALLQGVPALGALAGAVNPVTAAVAAAVAVSPELRDLLLELADALAPLLPILGEATVEVARLVTTGLAVVADLLRPLIPLVEAVVDTFGLLPEPIQAATLALGGLALALRFGGPVGIAVTALAALGAVVQLFTGDAGDATVAAKQFADSFDDLTGATTKATRALALQKLEQNDAAEAAERLGVDMADLVEAALGSESAMARVNEQMTQFAQDENITAGTQSSVEFSEAMEAVREGVAGVSDEVEQGEGLWRRHQEAQAGATDETQEHAGAQSDTAKAVDAATEAIRRQHDELRAQADPMFALHQALRGVEDAQTAYNEAVDEFGEGSTEAQDAAVALFEATLDLEGAALDASGAFDSDFIGSMKATLEAAGATEEQIDAVEDVLRSTNDELTEYEGEYEARVEQEGAEEAEEAAQRARRELERFASRSYTAEVIVEYGSRGEIPQNFARLPGRQHGGPIFGRPGPDRVPIMATAGEHVWTVREVQAAGGHQAVEQLRAAVLANSTRFAVGAPVGLPRPDRTSETMADPTEAGWTVEQMDIHVPTSRVSPRQIAEEFALHGAV